MSDWSRVPTLMRFTPADAEMLLSYLARLLDDDQSKAVISSTARSCA
ncbi:hypothetical protein [Actinacidiphila soli]|nr:hypothetical protein [Actinacidiphila soli]